MAAHTAGLAVAGGLRRGTRELGLAQASPRARGRPGEWRSRPGRRPSAPRRARCRRPAGRAAPPRRPPRPRRDRRHRTRATPSSAAAVPRSVASASAGSPDGTRSRARRACEIAVALSPSSPASCDRRSASCVGIAGRSMPLRLVIGGKRTIGVGQPIGDTLGLAAQEEHPRAGRAQLCVAADDLRGKGIEPAPHGAQLARIECRPEARATIRLVRSRSPDRRAWPIASSSSPRASCQADALACNPATSPGWSVRRRARRISAKSA